MTTLLQVDSLCKSFGGLQAIKNVSLEVEDGEIRGLIGPNGSGKSTLFNLISGVYKCDSGSVRFDGADVTNWEPHDIAAKGVARTFQLLRMFTEMTVLENLMIGQHCHVQYGPFAAVFGIGRVAAEEKRLRDEMMELLSFIGLADFAEVPASEMSIGQRRLLALGRGIAMKPKLLMLDEPAAGLSPVNVDNLMSIMVQLKKRYGLTVIVVEHILKVVMDTCERVTVLDHGEKIAEGSPAHVRDDHAVIEAYLGREMDDEEVRAAMAG
ncbi:ABC transporter ATP-binding protein [Pelagibius sp. Alg239-R121]|uniref:ABC transporter ATP-binding protein n=1 Tax=Pelagibius sp. Alg239-R121 TaxID=2993448 RepID=UPI0024A741CB|nr:ABC transporter ATP-binding protein [Pelagibius sp. Alg239-R121]